MYDRSRIWAISLLLVTFALFGCDGDDPVGGLPDGFNPVDIGGSVDALLQPAGGIAAPRAALQSAFSFLVEQGLTYDVVGDAIPALPTASGTAAAPRVIAGAVEIPAGFVGQTLVYNASQQTWAIDTERTGAPADGVRIIWYSADATGNFLLPLAEQGYIDLTDEDDATGSRIGIEMVSTPGPDVIADFTERLDSTATGTLIESDFSAAGFYVGGDETVDFQVDYFVSTDTISEDSDIVIDVTLNGTPGVYTLGIDGTEASSDDAINQDITAGITRQGITSVLNLELVQDAAGTQGGTGNLVHDGDVVVEITIEQNNFRYAQPGGGELGSGAAADVDFLVRALYLTGLDALLRLPLLFL